MSFSYIYLTFYTIPTLFLFILINMMMSIMFLGLAYYMSQKNSNKEKKSAYECGFNPFQEARISLDMRYYLVAILFIIFDLEIVFLFPWAVNFMDLAYLSWTSHFVVLIFIFMLTIAFMYEWSKGALDW